MFRNFTRTTGLLYPYNLYELKDQLLNFESLSFADDKNLLFSSKKEPALLGRI